MHLYQPLTLNKNVNEWFKKCYILVAHLATHHWDSRSSNNHIHDPMSAHCGQYYKRTLNSPKRSRLSQENIVVGGVSHSGRSRVTPGSTIRNRSWHAWGPYRMLGFEPGSVLFWPHGKQTPYHCAVALTPPWKLFNTWVSQLIILGPLWRGIGKVLWQLKPRQLSTLHTMLAQLHCLFTNLCSGT